MWYIVFGIMGFAHRAFTQHRPSTVKPVETGDAAAALHNLMDGWFESPPGLVLSTTSLKDMHSIPVYYFKDPIGFLEGMNVKHPDIVHLVERVFHIHLNKVMEEKFPYQPALAHIYHTATEAGNRGYPDLFESLGCTMVDWARFENNRSRQDVCSVILDAGEQLLRLNDRSSLGGFVVHVRDYAEDRLYGLRGYHKNSANGEKLHL